MGRPRLGEECLQDFTLRLHHTTLDDLYHYASETNERPAPLLRQLVARAFQLFQDRKSRPPRGVCYGGFRTSTLALLGLVDPRDEPDGDESDSTSGLGRR